RHTSVKCDWSSDVCSSDLATTGRRFPFSIFGEGKCGWFGGKFLPQAELGRLRFVARREVWEVKEVGGYFVIGQSSVVRGIFSVRSEERRVGKEGRPRVRLE